MVAVDLIGLGNRLWTPHSCDTPRESWGRHFLNLITRCLCHCECLPVHTHTSVLHGMVEFVSSVTFIHSQSLAHNHV